MSEPLNLAAALIAGAALGAFFFGGLWWTVRKGVASERPALWFLGSMLLRTGVVLPGFYLVSAGDWRRLLAALLGFVVARFVMARFVVVRLTRAAAQPGPLAQDAARAP